MKQSVWINDNHDYHRIDGPAIIYRGGYLSYYINNIRLDEDEVHKWRQENNVLTYPFTKEESMLFVLRFG